MAVIKRDTVTAPTVPKETLPVPALGGEVVVRGLLLSERMQMQARIVALRRDAVTDEGAVHTILPVLLALSVVDADGLAVFTHDQWQAFGARHADQAVTLFNAAWRLSGFSAAEEAKN